MKLCPASRYACDDTDRRLLVAPELGVPEVHRPQAERGHQQAGPAQVPQTSRAPYRPPSRRIAVYQSARCGGVRPAKRNATLALAHHQTETPNATDRSPAHDLQHREDVRRARDQATRPRTRQRRDVPARHHAQAGGERPPGRALPGGVRRRRHRQRLLRPALRGDRRREPVRVHGGAHRPAFARQHRRLRLRQRGAAAALAAGPLRGEEDRRLRALRAQRGLGPGGRWS